MHGKPLCPMPGRTASVSSARMQAIGVDRLLLTGATGFIGGNLFVTLINAGLIERMVCLVRAAPAWPMRWRGCAHRRCVAGCRIRALSGSPKPT